MNNDILIYCFAGLLGLLIWAWVLSEIIKSASRSQKIEHLLTYQIRLMLIQMKKDGISDEEISVASDFKKKIVEPKK